jgi:hypothetical protein
MVPSGSYEPLRLRLSWVDVLIINWRETMSFRNDLAAINCALNAEPYLAFYFWKKHWPELSNKAAWRLLCLHVRVAFEGKEESDWYKRHPHTAIYLPAQH